MGNRVMRVIAGEGGDPAGNGKNERARVYVPCPSCVAPIELPATVRQLPDELVCPSCRTRLKRDERPAST